MFVWWRTNTFLSLCSFIHMIRQNECFRCKTRTSFICILFQFWAKYWPTWISEYKCFFGSVCETVMLQFWNRKFLVCVVNVACSVRCFQLSRRLESYHLIASFLRFYFLALMYHCLIAWEWLFVLFFLMAIRVHPTEYFFN